MKVLDAKSDYLAVAFSFSAKRKANHALFHADGIVYGQTLVYLSQVVFDRYVTFI